MEFPASAIQGPSVLDAEVANVPLESLGLPTELVTYLRQQLGSVDIGGLYVLGAEGIAEALGGSIEEAGPVWAAILNMVSNPALWAMEAEEVQQSKVPDLREFDLVTHLGEAIESAFAGDGSRRLYAILVRRFGLNGSKEYTLEEIGEYFEVTRERVRQLETKAIRILRKHIEQLLLMEIEPIDWAKVASEVSLISQIVEAQGNPICREDDLFEMISQRYSVSLTDEQRAELRLLFTVLGWKERRHTDVRGRNMHPHWVVRSAKIDLPRLDTAAKKIVQLLLRECIGVPYFDIKIALNRKSQDKYSDLYIRSALSLVRDIEAISDDRYQIAFDRLSNAGDQAYRILYEAGEPLGIRELYRRVAERLARQGGKIVSLRSIQNQVVNDVRFIPIGKKAWVLSSWKDIVSDTVVSVMRQYFLETGEPARGQAVYEYVQKRRPVERNSIQTYLADREEFVRVDRGLYQLAEWGNKRAKKVPSLVRAKWTAKALTDVVIRIFQSRSLEVMPVAELVQHLKAEMGVTQIGYEALQRCPALEITVISENPRRLQARLVSDTVDDHDFRTLRERVQEAVRAILRRQPDMSMQLQGLKKAVQTLMDVQSHTFYRYLSEMIDIQKAQIPKLRETLVTLIGDETTGNVEVADIWDRKYIYDIAISYSGNERDIARALAGSLKSLDSDLRVFFDRNQLPDLIGRNLADELMLIYERNARLCVILASEAYNKSKWAQLERQSAQARQMNDKGYIVLVKLDGVPRIEGFLSTVAYLDYKDYPVDAIAAHTLEQLKRSS